MESWYDYVIPIHTDILGLKWIQSFFIYISSYLCSSHSTLQSFRSICSCSFLFQVKIFTLPSVIYRSFALAHFSFFASIFHDHYVWLVLFLPLNAITTSFVISLNFFLVRRGGYIPTWQAHLFSFYIRKTICNFHARQTVQFKMATSSNIKNVNVTWWSHNLQMKDYYIFTFRHN